MKGKLPINQNENNESVKKEKKENTTLKRLISQCLNKRDQSSFGSISSGNSLYSLKQMWEDSTFKFLKKLGIEPYLDQIIKRGTTICPQGIVLVSNALQHPIGISERVRLKVNILKKL
jgi:hypothetical protein